MTAKEYWDKAEQLRKRIKRKNHEICILRQRAEGMGDSGMSDMPRTVSPEPSRMESIICKIIALEQEIRDIQQEYNHLIADMQNRIEQVDNEDARDLLTKRYLEFKPWKTIADEMYVSVRTIYNLRNKAVAELP